MEAVSLGAVPNHSWWVFILVTLRYHQVEGQAGVCNLISTAHMHLHARREAMVLIWLTGGTIVMSHTARRVAGKVKLAYGEQTTKQQHKGLECLLLTNFVLLYFLLFLP